MERTFPLTPDTVFEIQASVVFDTERFLRQHGLHGHEGMVFWGGVPFEGLVEIRRAMHPAQSCSAVSVDIDPAAVQQMYRTLETHREILVAQVHSHPGGAFHSARDDAFPATFLVGYLSIVVPDFCRRGLRFLEDCSVWIHTGLGRWRELGAIEKAGKLVILSGESE